MIDKTPIENIPDKAVGGKHFASEFNTVKQFLLDTADAVNGKAIGYVGFLKKSTTGPFLIGLYRLLEFGNYPNLTPAEDENGDPTTIQAASGKLNEAYYDGFVWTESKADVSVNESLIKLSVDGTAPSINLFNINDPNILNDIAVFDSSYSMGTLSGYKVVGIDVLPNTQYTWLKSGLGGKNMQYANSSGANIGGLKIGTAGNPDVRVTFTTPSGCFKIFYTCKSSSESTIPAQMMLVQGNGLKSDGVTELDFEPYGDVTGDGTTILPYNPSHKIIAGLLEEGATMEGVPVATLDDIPVIPGGYVPIPSNFVTVVVSGSSITNGVGASGENTKWRVLLKNTLTNVLGRTITVVNGGVDGQTTTGMASNLPALLSTNNPQVVIIEASINDAKINGDGISISQSISNINQMVNLVVAQNRIPIITTPVPINMISPNDENFSQQKRSDLAYAAKLIAYQKNVRIVDMDSIFNGDLSGLSSDGLHPSDKGHLAIANCINSAILTN